jgi:mannose-6-phosphate isomerase
MNIVPKVWGYEHWLVNRDYCGKMLHLDRGKQCSLHYHERKDETIFVMSGRVRLELGDAVMVLCAGDSQHVGAGTKHRFAGLDHSVILEISTHDDNDTVRLEPSGEMKP